MTEVEWQTFQDKKEESFDTQTDTHTHIHMHTRTLTYTYNLVFSLVCHSYVTRMYSYVIPMSLVRGFTMNPHDNITYQMCNISRMICIN